MMILIASLFTVLAIQPAVSEPNAYELNRQGRDLLDQHRYLAAIRIFRQAVDRANAEPGPQDPAAAMILRNLALAYAQSGDAASAEQNAKYAYSIVESQFGPAEPGLTPILNVLAECYASSGRIDEAERVTKQAVSIGPLAGVHYGIALHNLGALRELSGDREGAASSYQSAIVVKTQTLGAGHPYVALSRVALRRVLHRDSLTSHTDRRVKLTLPSE
jgi:tetratricopeptide (TPR) repeat protein